MTVKYGARILILMVLVISFNIACGRSRVEFKGGRLSPAMPETLPKGLAATNGGSFSLSTSNGYRANITMGENAGLIQASTPGGYKARLNIQGATVHQ